MYIYSFKKKIINNSINNYCFLELLNHIYTWPMLAKYTYSILFLAQTFPNDLMSV